MRIKEPAPNGRDAKRGLQGAQVPFPVSGHTSAPFALLSKMPLLVFDSNISRNNPIGSCLLNMLLPLVGRWPMHVFVNKTDLPDGAFVRKTKIPLPRGPVFARVILYTLFSSCASAISGSTQPNLRISSEGAFPFSEISYVQFCHRFFLSHHRDALAGSWLRRWARLITHTWDAAMEKIALRSARTVVVPSRGLAHELEAQYPELVRGKIRIIPNPVDVDSFSRPQDYSSSPILSQFNIPPDALVLSFCALGGFERKGLRVVLEALAGFEDRCVHLLVIGGSPGEIREYQMLSDQLGVGESVHFAGLQRDIRPYLWASRAFVFPSAYEGFALACLQAAAAGLPLITTSINGIEEFIKDGVNGWIVDRTARSVQAAIRDAGSSLERTALLGEAAKRDVQVYRQEIFQARWLELLQRECHSHA